MNSVFSVFKSNSSSGGGASNHSTSHNKISHTGNNGVSQNGHHNGGGGGGSPLAGAASLIDAAKPAKYATKKITSDSSYENLRHIREIESCTKMGSFVDVTARDDVDYYNNDVDDDADATHTIRLNGGKRCVTPVVVSSAVAELAQDEDLDDDVHVDVGGAVAVDTVDCATVSAKPPLPVEHCGAKTPIGARESHKYAADAAVRHSPPSSSTIPAAVGSATNLCASASASPAPHAPIIVAHSRGHSESNLCATQKTTTRFQKRLSLSGFANNSMPSVHGRPSSAAAAAASNGGSAAATNGASGTGEVKRTRLSTHQRNLSLDFR